MKGTATAQCPWLENNLDMVPEEIEDSLQEEKGQGASVWGMRWWVRAMLSPTLRQEE